MQDRPSLDAVTLGVVSAASGLTLTREQLEAAVAFSDAMRDDLERIRAVPLEFTGRVVTPFDALAWIDNGGQGSPFAANADDANADGAAKADAADG